MNHFPSLRRGMRHLLVPVLGALLLAAGPVRAQTWPAKPIRVVISAAAGTGSDVLTRLVVNKMADRLKTQVVVENRTGAGAIVGVNYLKSAPADGYTIGVVQSANTIQPWLVKDLPFDLRRDFAPLVLQYTVPLQVFAAVDGPIKSVAEVPAYVKANPGKVFFGTTGVGSTGHLSGELWKQLAGLDMTAVFFKGSPEMISAAVSGNIQIYFDALAASKPLVEAGRLRILAVTSKTRMSTLPNVPALAESFPGFDVIGWVGLAAPRGTPRDIVERLAGELGAVLQQPDTRKTIIDGGGEPSGMGPADFLALINADTEKWGRVVKAAGLKTE